MEIRKAEKVVVEMAPDWELIKFVMDYYTMRAEKYGVLNGPAQSGCVFFITGYVPENVVAKSEKLLQEEYEVVVEYTGSGDKEDAPTLLHDSRPAEPMEGVIESHSIPPKREIDLFMIVALLYYVQLGLVLSDAVCGPITVAGIVYHLAKFKNTEVGMRKFMKMFTHCGTSTTFWSFMFGSFFGDVVNVITTTFLNRPGTRLAPLQFEPVSLPVKLPVFTFGPGTPHLFTGLGIEFCSCVKNGSLADGTYDVIFWYMLVGGGTIYLLTIPMFTEMLGLTSVLPAVAGTTAAYVTAIGFVGIVLTSGQESRSWVKRILKDLHGAYEVSLYPSDIPSYSRFLVLGLAISVMSTVFNKIGSIMGTSTLGAAIFILVSVIGHSLSLVINTLGAHAYTSRLRYVEFFEKSYEGDGRRLELFVVYTKYYKTEEDTQLWEV